MNKLIVFTTLALGLSACTPHYPPASSRDGLCEGRNCKVDNAPAEVYYQKFMAGTVGSCAEPAKMKFTYMEASSVLPTSQDGFAAIRLYLLPNGTYHGSYIDPLGQFGIQNPGTKGKHQGVKHIKGEWHLGDDKIVIDGIGMGHKLGDDEILVQPTSSSELPLVNPVLISFTAKQSDKNEKGQTAQEVCATPAN